MKVYQLKRELNKLDEQAEILIASDEEGNSYGDIDPQIEQIGEHKRKKYIIYPSDNMTREEI